MIDPPSIPTDAEYVPPSYYRYTRQLGRQNTPAMGVGVNQLGGPNGTSLEVRKQLFGGTANHALALSPFQIYQHSFNPSTLIGVYYVHTGRIIRPTEGIAFIASNDDSAGSPLAISVGASVTNYVVWLDITISISSGVITKSAQVLAAGSSGWTGYSTPMNSGGT